MGCGEFGERELQTRDGVVELALDAAPGCYPKT